MATDWADFWHRTYPWLTLLCVGKGTYRSISTNEGISLSQSWNFLLSSPWYVDHCKCCLLSRTEDLHQFIRLSIHLRHAQQDGCEAENRAGSSFHPKSYSWDLSSSIFFNRVPLGVTDAGFYTLDPLPVTYDFYLYQSGKERTKNSQKNQSTFDTKKAASIICNPSDKSNLVDNSLQNFNLACLPINCHSIDKNSKNDQANSLLMYINSMIISKCRQEL